MAYLNWSDRPLQISLSRLTQQPASASEAAGWEHTTLHLRLASVEWEELCQELQQFYQEGEQELRCRLGLEGTLFFTKRPQGARAQIAYPEVQQWVATFGLSQAQADLLVQALRQLVPQKSLQVSELIKFGSFSNFAWTLERL